MNNIKFIKKLKRFFFFYCLPNFEIFITNLEIYNYNETTSFLTASIIIYKQHFFFFH